MNILEQIEALKWHGDVSMADLKQFAADHRKLRERLADAERVIDHYARRDNWKQLDGRSQADWYDPKIIASGYDLAAEYRKKYPEVIE